MRLSLSLLLVRLKGYIGCGDKVHFSLASVTNRNVRSSDQGGADPRVAPQTVGTCKQVPGACCVLHKGLTGRPCRERYALGMHVILLHAE
jgi:hypothetical protein